jgi:spermidine synthase
VENGQGTATAPASGEAQREALTLLGSVFLIAGCGLVYELLLATVSSYLLGNSVTQFSLCIGLFIGSMGVGSYLSQRVHDRLLDVFLGTEAVLAVLGGSSVTLLFWTYPLGVPYYFALYGTLLGVGALVGLELPLLTRLLKDYGTLRTVLAQALSFDYLGALAGSVLFPLLLLPSLGLMRTACLIGLVNVGVLVWNVRVFWGRLARPHAWLVPAGVVGAVLAAAFAGSVQLVGLLERRLYEDEIILAEQTPYQRIVVTRWRDDLRLFLNGHLQASLLDEYRYHEALVHPAMAQVPRAESVLILGGGDGFGVREVLKYEGVQRVTVVDIDPRMTELGRTFPALVEANAGALNDPRVTIVNEDAFAFLGRGAELYDVILADLPDPSSDVLAKLYCVEFYRLVRRRRAATGAFATQATSPFFTRDAFWCIHDSVAAAGLHPAAYRAYVPSFGEWGFVLAGPQLPRRERLDLPVPTRYLTAEMLPAMFALSKDIRPVPLEVSTLDRPVVLTYYGNGYQRWARTEAEAGR